MRRFQHWRGWCGGWQAHSDVGILTISMATQAWPWHPASCVLAVVAVAGGCSREESAPPVETVPQKSVGIAFPDSARVGDDEVNRFVRTAIESCINGEYEQFRALWSAVEEPLDREQFDRGWRTAQRISIHEIRPMRDPKDGAILYYVHAIVELAPEIRKPKRDVVLLIVRENDAWRLARAPKALVEQVLGNKSRDSES